MTMLERAIARLKELPAEEQENWAAMILQELEEPDRYRPTDEQVAEIKRRLAEPNPVYLTLEEAEERLAKLLG